jgi:serine/threonine protein kinase/N-acetylneuraminic acid mutarotase
MIGDDFEAAGARSSGSPRMSDLVGRQLGQYEIRELVRQGGMATVYKAYQPSLDRWVAVKVLARPDDATFVARFEAEARSVARFQHPNIVPVHDYGEQEGYLYLVVTYVEDGRSLAELVGRPMATDRALRFGVQILAGLAYAHGKGVVHRDVKPSNVLLPSLDWSMLADFGIAKLLHGQGRDLTRPGMVLGTAAYMAPEQTFGLPVDPRTDLYSVGIVLYELVTAQVPFEGDNPVMVMMKQAYEPPEPPRKLNPDVPVEVEDLLLRVLAKDPAARFQSAEAMSATITAALAGVQDKLPVSAPSVLDDPLSAYMAGIDAYTAGRWAEAVERFSSVHATNPGYEDVEAMLEAARTAREHFPGGPPSAPRPRPAAAEAATRPAPTPAAPSPAEPGGTAGPPVPPPGQSPPVTPRPTPPALPDRGRAPVRPAAAAAQSVPTVPRTLPDRGPKTPEAPAAGAGSEPEPATSEGRRWGRLLWVVAAVVAVVAATLIVLSSANRGQGTRTVSTALPATTTAPKAWTATAEAPFGVESAGTAAFQGKAWVVGGLDRPGHGRADVLVYDPAKDAWSEGPRLPGAINHAALVSTGKQLFVIGGYTGSTIRPVRTVRRLDQAASRWVDAPDLPVAVGAGAAAWDGRRIVYAGGVGSDHQPSSSVFAFEHGSWRRLGALSRAREHLAAASDGKGTTYFLAGEVNHAGARTVLGTVDAVEADTVRLVGFVPTARGSVAGFFFRRDGACVGGGRDGRGGLFAEVECIGPDGATRRLPPLQTARHGLGMVVIDGSAYALLGSDDQGRTFRSGEVHRLAS